MDSAEQQIDGCENLHLIAIELTPQVGVRVTVQEAIPGQDRPEDLERDYTPELADSLQARYAAERLPIPRVFEISFAEIISYTVVNESYGRFPEPPERFTGRLFRRFSWSYLLEWTRKTSYASDVDPGPGPLRHFQIACLNEVVDVIAAREPAIVVLMADPHPRYLS